MKDKPRAMRPTAEEWYHATSVIPDAPTPIPDLPTPQPTPPRQQPRAEQPRKRRELKVKRRTYWLSVFGMWSIFAVTAAVKIPNHTEVLFITSVILVLVYIVVAAMRSYDMGKTPWFSFAALIPILGVWPFLWMGIAESNATGKIRPEKEENELAQILCGIGICTILVAIGITMLTLVFF